MPNFTNILCMETHIGPLCTDNRRADAKQLREDCFTRAFNREAARVWLCRSRIIANTKLNTGVGTNDTSFRISTNVVEPLDDLECHMADALYENAVACYCGANLSCTVCADTSSGVGPDDTLGPSLPPEDTETEEDPFSSTVSSEESPIPFLFGRTVVPGNIIYVSPARRVTVGARNYYVVDLEVALGVGPVQALSRVFYSGSLVYDNSSVFGISDNIVTDTGTEFILRTGSNAQNPYGHEEDFGRLPAYRGVSTVIIKNFIVNPNGERIGDFLIEVLNGNVSDFQEVPSVSASGVVKLFDSQSGASLAAYTDDSIRGFSTLTGEAGDVVSLSKDVSADLIAFDSTIAQSWHVADDDSLVYTSSVFSGETYEVQLSETPIALSATVIPSALPSSSVVFVCGVLFSDRIEVYYKEPRANSLVLAGTAPTSVSDHDGILSTQNTFVAYRLNASSVTFDEVFFNAFFDKEVFVETLELSAESPLRVETVLDSKTIVVFSETKYVTVESRDLGIVTNTFDSEIVLPEFRPAGAYPYSFFRAGAVYDGVGVIPTGSTDVVLYQVSDTNNQRITYLTDSDEIKTLYYGYPTFQNNPLSSTITTILEAAGVDRDFVKAEDVDSVDCRGFIISTAVDAKDALQSLADFYGLKFIGSLSSISIQKSFPEASTESDYEDRLISFESFRKQDESSVSDYYKVQYYDDLSDLKIVEQVVEKRFVLGDTFIGFSGDYTTQKFDITATSQQAVEAAERLLLQDLNVESVKKVTLTASSLDTLPGDAFIDSDGFEFSAGKLVLDSDNTIEIEYVSDSIDDDISLTPQTVLSVRQQLSGRQPTAALPYQFDMGVPIRGPIGEIPNLTVFSPFDISFSTVEMFGELFSTTLDYGVVQSVNDVERSEIYATDVNSHFDIFFAEGLPSGLSSVPLTALYDSFTTNLLIVGSEYVQFANIEEVSPNIFRISTLLRGRFGTESSINTHVEKEKVVVYDANKVLTTRLSTRKDELIDYVVNANGSDNFHGYTARYDSFREYYSNGHLPQFYATNGTFSKDLTFVFSAAQPWSYDIVDADTLPDWARLTTGLVYRNGDREMHVCILKAPFDKETFLENVDLGGYDGYINDNGEVLTLTTPSTNPYIHRAFRSTTGLTYTLEDITLDGGYQGSQTEIAVYRGGRKDEVQGAYVPEGYNLQSTNSTIKRPCIRVY